MRYTSNITFLYYKDIEYGKNFMTKVLELEEVMDQGFAVVYKANETSFIGVVQKDNPNPGDTLISLNVDDVDLEYERVRKLPTFDLSEVNYMSHIPLRSFFFNDYVGHRFEIQEFQKPEDKEIF